MSSEFKDNEGDLIDLHVRSPVLPRAATNFEVYAETSDNLIDTELPILEQKLQTASNIVPPRLDSRRTSVDVEDILISIDSDDDDRFFDLCGNEIEALDVLKDLDEVLNRTLEECEDGGSSSSTQQDIECCLQDLDEYLRGIDSSSYDECSDESTEEVEEANTVDVSDNTLRKKLRQMEENYTKFLASGFVNRGYVHTETAGNDRRPLSACELPAEPETDRFPARATVTVVSKERPSLLEWEKCMKSRCRFGRDLEQERRAHSSGDRCTGTVVVEVPPPTPSSEYPKWLRSSMRRLHHLRFPDEVGTPSEDVVDVVPTASAAPRPVSAPARTTSVEDEEASAAEPEGNVENPGTVSGPRRNRSRSLTSSESSIPTSVDSTPSGTTGAASPTQNGNILGNAERSCDRNRQNDMPEVESPLGHWPHSLSSMMACLGCTLGLFNISRFAILAVHFGANFIFQFFLLSIVFGLPLFTLQLCLGQQLGAGVIDMWRISPLFQGVGVSLLITQAFIGLYSIIGVSWMFVFFRDSFITKIDRYRWAEPFSYYRREVQAPVNETFKISDTVPAYFHGVVLQRHHISSENVYGTIKFQLAFNLAVVWMIIFVSLSKGLRSYGKVVYAFTFLPILGTFVLCAKMLGLMPPEFVNAIFPETIWSEFFLNHRSWLAASQETFLTWGLMGAAVMQIASHNKHKHLLQRDSSLVAVITFTILLLVGFLANTCVQILKANGYSYLPSSFERTTTYVFLRPGKDPLPPSLANTPVRYMVHNSFVLGDRIMKPNIDRSIESGYQVLRLATELVPAALAVMGTDQVSPFWAVLFYFILIMFGIAQQLAIWHCVITGIMAIKAKILKSWETTITFFSCACGFILGLPMATELGIYVVYFFDFTIGGIWWLVIVILLQILAVFMVRGRPYSGDTVVTALFYQNRHPCFLSWAPAMLSFTWNVILPVALMVLCIATFKNGSFRDMLVWHHAPLAEYWPLWSRQIGSILQLFPLLCIPLVAVIQSYRYLNNGPTDILDENEEPTDYRIQLLYRPPIGEHMDELAVQEAAAAIRSDLNSTAIASEDPPPKYTPPPSYTTATGARLAKFLRQSIRRSVRRIANVLGEGTSSRRPTPSQSNPPPDYNTVLVEMNNTTITDTTDGTNVRVSTLERLRNLEASPNALTAAEVASILRSSFRRSTARQTNNIRNATFNDNMASLSAQNLVDSAAPIGETSLVMDQLTNEIERKIENNNTSSVI